MGAIMKNYMNYSKENIINAIYYLEKMDFDTTKGLDRVIQQLEAAKEHIEKAIKIGKEHL